MKLAKAVIVVIVKVFSDSAGNINWYSPLRIQDSNMCHTTLNNFPISRN